MTKRLVVLLLLLARTYIQVTSCLRLCWVRATGVQQTLTQLTNAAQLLLLSSCPKAMAATSLPHCVDCGYECVTLISRAPKGRNGLLTGTQQHLSAKL
jgi:hypothetical protein